MQDASHGGTAAELIAVEESNGRLHLRLVVEEPEPAQEEWMVSCLMTLQSDINATAAAAVGSRCLLVRPQWSGRQPAGTLVRDQQSMLACQVAGNGSPCLIAGAAGGAASLHIAGRPVKSFARDVDLMHVDHLSGLMVVYTRADGEGRIRVLRALPSFQQMSETGIEVDLAQAGSKDVVWMRLVPGRQMVVIVDGEGRVRAFELGHKAMLKPRDIELKGGFSGRMCCTPDGSCLLHLTTAKTGGGKEDRGTGSDGEMAGGKDGNGNDVGGNRCDVVIEVYKIDTMTRLTTLQLGAHATGSLDNWQIGCAAFGPQQQLFLLNTASHVLHHCCLHVSVAASKRSVRSGWVGAGGAAAADTSAEPVGALSRFGGCHKLDLLLSAYERFATSPYFGQRRHVNVHLLVGQEQVGEVERALLQAQVCRIVDRLKQERGKDMSKLRLHGGACGLIGLPHIVDKAREIARDEWLRTLLCPLPIQIARAENNSLKPMIDGQSVPRGLVFANTEALASQIRLGAYEEILAQWKGPLKVVSSMGKQSSGKSYLLNHLSGSPLAVADGRCTDGVWMTVREAGGCLYVLLDFEGLGSFERSEQEDMLLSVLNAAISSLTIFNKKVRGRMMMPEVVCWC